MKIVEMANLLMNLKFFENFKIIRMNRVTQFSIITTYLYRLTLSLEVIHQAIVGTFSINKLCVSAGASLSLLLFLIFFLFVTRWRGAWAWTSFLLFLLVFLWFFRTIGILTTAKLWLLRRHARLSTHLLGITGRSSHLLGITGRSSHLTIWLHRLLLRVLLSWLHHHPWLLHHGLLVPHLGLHPHSRLTILLLHSHHWSLSIRLLHSHRSLSIRLLHSHRWLSIRLLHSHHRLLHTHRCSTHWGTSHWGTSHRWLAIATTLICTNMTSCVRIG